LIRRLSTTVDSVSASGELVKSLLPNSRVLDCACGTGPLTVAIATLGLDVVATGASLGMVRLKLNPQAEAYIAVAGRE
jgi:2-polyprenyl-3-methyl-5-hydroxy-6-metoxy-1,4-benzoquinol methylase